MGKTPRTLRPDRGKAIKATKGKALKGRKPKSYLTCLYANATIENYGTIARGLGIKIGPNVPPLVDQLSFNSFKINSLYRSGYDVESLYAQLIKRIQIEIIDGLPF